MQYLQSLEKFGMSLGLDRIRRILSKLGNPQKKFPSIHVAGTNGKGSTCAMIASILKQQGYKVGLYTSPHLFDYRERIQINGKMINKAEFGEGISLVRAVAENPTVFEVLTAVAFWYFAKKKVDYAVVEVGLGGRLDATNVLTPLVAVITNIDLEHTRVLGKSLAKIAKEKAAIIKPGIPVVTAENKKSALDVIRQRSKVCGSRVVMIENTEHRAQNSEHSYCCGLIGEHQRTNAACALAAILAANIQVGKKAINAGLKKVKWPGRFQILSGKPLIIIDGAHNPAGIKTLVVTIKSMFPGKRFTVLFGCQQDKDQKNMLKQLRSIADKVIITRSSHQHAAKIKGAVSIKTALNEWDKRSPLLVCGSLFLLSDFLTKNYMIETPH